MDGRATHIDRCILGIQYRRRCNYAGNHITVGGIGRVQGRVCNPFGIIAAGNAALQQPMREGERPNGGKLAHQTRDFLYSLCEVKHKCGRALTFAVMFAFACLFAYGMQFESVVKYGMRYFLYADLAIGIVFPLIVMWVKTKKRVKWGIGFVCLTVLAAVGSVWIGDEKLGRQFVQNDFTASEQKKQTMEYREKEQKKHQQTANNP